jgi:diguanylate cyclase (GGDEF)-like protein
MTPLNVQDRSLKQRTRLNWLALGLGLTLVGSVVGYNLATMRQRVIEQEQHRLMTQSRVIGRNIEHQLDATSRILQGVVADRDTLAAPQNRAFAVKRLSIMADAMPGMRTLFITDAAGTIIASSRPELIGRNFSYRDYFSTPRHHPDPQALYVSSPFKSVLDTYTFNFTRMIPAADGSFNGVVTSSVDPGYFETILQSTLYAPDMLNTINHGDGIRFMTRPEREGQAGKNLAVPGSLFSLHRESGRLESSLTGTAYATGEQRMAALFTIQPAKLRMDKPLVVIISRNPAAVLADWHNEAFFQGVLFLIGCLGSTGGLFLLHRSQAAAELKAQRVETLVQLRYQLLDYATMHSVDELLRFALDEVCRISGSPVGFYHFVDPDQQALTLQAWSTRTLQEYCKAEGHGMHYDIKQAGVWVECVHARAPVIHNDYAALPHKKGLPAGHAPVIRELVVPVIRDERFVAILGVGNKPDNYTSKDVDEVSYLADVTWEIIDGRRAHEELKQANELLAAEARIDFLTGIYNRRMFENLLLAEMARACRFATPLSLIMFDLDHFKQVNDILGHAVGDQVLQKVAELVSGRIRTHDIFSRWGGEEFVILTFRNDEDQATVLAEMLREMIAQHVFIENQQITASFGITCHRCGESPQELMARVDAALYQAKHKGRNRVEIL